MWFTCFLQLKEPADTILRNRTRGWAVLLTQLATLQQNQVKIFTPLTFERLCVLQKVRKSSCNEGTKYWKQDLTRMLYSVQIWLAFPFVHFQVCTLFMLTVFPFFKSRQRPTHNRQTLRTFNEKSPNLDPGAGSHFQMYRTIVAQGGYQNIAIFSCALRLPDLNAVRI